LGRKDIGSLEVGKCADFVALNMNRLDYAGALSDPLAAILFCAPQRVDWSFVHGNAVVKDGMLVNVDLHKLITEHNTASKRLLGEIG
jgi:cytosine/adenosine deaminase-related metal-dependent hydrolase